MIHIVTICIALRSTNDWTILSGIIESRNPEKLKASNLSGVKLSKSKLTHFHGLNAFISIRDVVIASVVVSI